MSDVSRFREKTGIGPIGCIRDQSGRLHKVHGVFHGRINEGETMGISIHAEEIDRAEGAVIDLPLEFEGQPVVICASKGFRPLPSKGK
ncbi:MAG: hypothetical protein NUV56_01345 [Candidatus Uhrbacteria bacterium]|nr:hypothetical protein [Candidatus Uhrbacteria bacterium]